jgi:prepilin-type N-terminal cleavage/methylation domain-containing protein
MKTISKIKSLFKAFKAFTLIEVMVVIVLLALLLGAAIPFFGWARNKANDDNASNRAILLNSAKSQYLLEYGYLAHTAFNARTNANKYAVLLQYMNYSATDLPSYTPSGYTYSLKTLAQKTAVTATDRGISLSY